MSISSLLSSQCIGGGLYPYLNEIKHPGGKRMREHTDRQTSRLELPAPGPKPSTLAVLRTALTWRPSRQAASQPCETNDRSNVCSFV